MVSFLLFWFYFFNFSLGYFLFLLLLLLPLALVFSRKLQENPERELQTQTANSYASEMSGQYLRQGREQSICNISSLSWYMQEIV